MTTMKSTILAVMPHLLLNVTSFQFHVPTADKREQKNPQIWDEYRLHNFIFVLRHCLCIWISAYDGFALEDAFFYRFVAVIACHLAADFVSKFWGSPSKGRTMETMPTEKSWKWKDLITYYHGFMQIGAISAAIANFHPASNFFVILPIQLSSFLMTLNHKHIDHKNSSSRYQYLYNGSLFLAGVILNFAEETVTPMRSLIWGLYMIFYFQINRWMNPRKKDKQGRRIPTPFAFNPTKYFLMTGFYLIAYQKRLAMANDMILEA